MAAGKGTGELVLRIFHNQTGRIVYRSLPRQVRFVGSPDAILGVVFRVRNCSFLEGGLYWVELLFAGAVIARQRLWLK